MISFEGRRIYLACGITDGRKSINGLTAMVKYSFQKSIGGMSRDKNSDGR
jgi:hypothetical protein